MDRAAADQTTKAFLTHIQRALSEAAGIARAAEICAENGNLPAAIKLAMDIEYPAYQTQQMLKASLLIRGEILGDMLD